MARTTESVDNAMVTPINVQYVVDCRHFIDDPVGEGFSDPMLFSLDARLPLRRAVEAVIPMPCPEADTSSRTISVGFPMQQQGIHGADAGLAVEGLRFRFATTAIGADGLALNIGTFAPTTVNLLEIIRAAQIGYGNVDPEPVLIVEHKPGGFGGSPGTDFVQFFQALGMDAIVAALGAAAPYIARRAWPKVRYQRQRTLASEWSQSQGFHTSSDLREFVDEMPAPERSKLSRRLRLPQIEYSRV